jgi:hypothetical protein
VGHISRHGVTAEECEEAYRNAPDGHRAPKATTRTPQTVFRRDEQGRLPTFVVTERRGKIRFVTAHPMHPTQREIYRGEKYDGQDQDSQL